MTVIVFASPKGGAGKSTSAVLLAAALSTNGTAVTLIDADPNAPVGRWGKTRETTGTLDVIDGVTEKTIIDVIEAADAQSEYVVVDLEGTGSTSTIYAISRADLVVIPTQASVLDAYEAVATIRAIALQEKAFKKKIKSVVLFTRTSAAIRPRLLTSLAAEFVSNGTRVMNTQLHDRDAFRALFTFGGTLENLESSQVRNVPAAMVNAQAFADEICLILEEPA